MNHFYHFYQKGPEQGHITIVAILNTHMYLLKLKIMCESMSCLKHHYFNCNNCKASAHPDNSGL